MAKSSFGRDNGWSQWRRAPLLLLAAAIVVLVGCEETENGESGPPNPNSADVTVYTDTWGAIAEGIEGAVVGDGWPPNESARQAVATALGDTATYFGDWAADGWVVDGDTRVYETMSPLRRRWKIEPSPESGWYYGRLDVDYNGDGSFDDESDYGDTSQSALNYLFADFNGLLHLYHSAIGTRLSVEESGNVITLSGTTSGGDEISLQISVEEGGTSGSVIGTLNGALAYEW